MLSSVDVSGARGAASAAWKSACICAAIPGRSGSSIKYVARLAAICCRIGAGASRHVSNRACAFAPAWEKTSAQSVAAVNWIVASARRLGGGTTTGLIAMALVPTTATPAAMKGRGIAGMSTPRRRVTPDPREPYLRGSGEKPDFGDERPDSGGSDRCCGQTTQEF